MEVANIVARMFLDRDPTQAEIAQFNDLPPAELSARLNRLEDLLAQAKSKTPKTKPKIGNGRQVSFDKKFLLKLVSGPAPDKTIEYQDTHTDSPSLGGTYFLRARHFKTGGVKLSVLRTPPNARQAIRVTLKDFPVDDALKMPELRKAAATIAMQISDGENPNAKPETEVLTGPVTLRIASHEFLIAKRGSLADRTLDNVERNLTKHLASYLDREMKDLLTVRQIAEIRATAKESCAKNPHAKGGDTGANNVLRSFRRLVNFAQAMHPDAGIPDWPAKQIKELGGMWTKENKRKSRLKINQFPRYWAALQQQPALERDFFTMLLLTGARKSELLKLTVADVDFEGGTFTFVDPKNGHDHVLALTGTLRALLCRRIEARGLTKAERSRKEFSTWRLFRLDARTTTNRIIKATTTEELAGIKITPHDCRRTFANTAAYACDLNKERIAALLNHLTGQTVTNEYMGEAEIEEIRADLEAIEIQIMKRVEADSE